MLGREMREWSARWHTRDGFSAYVAALRAQSTVVPAGWVPTTSWWWVAGREHLGRIALRHRLNERLLEHGGHIGYDVRPAARRAGHATAMLRAVRQEAHARGIDPALVTCDRDNLGSRGAITHNGGILQACAAP